MELFTLICSLIAACAGLTAIATFLFTRQKAATEKTEARVALEKDLKYLRESLDDTRLEVKELLRQSTAQNERLSKDDIRITQLESRINQIEKRLNILETNALTD